MPDVYCEWYTCNWNDEDRGGKCLYDGRINLLISQEPGNATEDLLECDKYYWLAVKHRD